MRVALVSLTCAACLLAACGSRDAALPQPRAATARTATARTAIAVPLAPGSDSLADEQEPIDVGALRLSQPEDAEPEPVR